MSQPLALREPELSPAARRVLAALLLSLGLHAAIIGLVRLAPSVITVGSPPVMQVNLPAHRIATEAELVKPVKGDMAVMTASASKDVVILASPPDLHIRNTALPHPADAAASLAAPVAQSVAASVPLPAQSGLPTVNVPLLVDNTYYTAKEVDVHPRALQPVVPVYPETAADQNIQGWVLLKIKLDEAGKVEEIKVGDATPPGVFEQAALDVFTKAQFAPAQKGGRAVKSLVEIKVWFKLN